jgi:hypothetical protein
MESPDVWIDLALGLSLALIVAAYAVSALEN